MKKLIMLLAAICAVGIAQGSYVDWKFGKDTSYNGYTVYAFDSADQATVLAALSAFDSDALTTINNKVLSSKTVSKGNALYNGLQVDDSTTSLMLLAINGAFEAGKDYKYDTLDISGSTYGATDPSPDTPATLSSFGNSGTIVAAGGGGGGGGAPEPTSGLLLLVGGAMLALRRKQK